MRPRATAARRTVARSGKAPFTVDITRAVIKVESDYDTHVVSSADCKGLMQVHPQVEIDMGAQGDIFDARTNIVHV